MSLDLQIDAVSKAYGRVRALQDVTLRAAAGSRLAIVGPSGSGKTTLLRLIAGFDAPDSGTIQIGDVCLSRPGLHVPAHKRDIGIVAQDGALFPHLSIAQNIGFGLPKDFSGRDAEIAALLDMVGLDRRMLSRRPDEISGGQQQRVALARALARRPKLMLLDEPFSALDTGLRASTRRAVSDLLGARAITTVLVTHDQGEALSFADQVAVMHEGRVLQAGDPRELYASPQTPFVAEFLGEALLLDADCHAGVATCKLGRAPLPSDAPDGRRRILLRPEQVVLQSVNGTSDKPTCRIEAIEFGGSQSILRLRLLEPAAAEEAPVILRRSGVETMRVGDLAAITIVGAAHVFPDA